MNGKRRHTESGTRQEAVLDPESAAAAKIRECGASFLRSAGSSEERLSDCIKVYALRSLYANTDVGAYTDDPAVRLQGRPAGPACRAAFEAVSRRRG